MNKRLSLVWAVGGLASLVLGLEPACSSQSSSHGGRLLGDGGGLDGASSDSGSGAGGGGSVRSSPFGKACLKDTDCGVAGLTCLTSSSKALAGGGPANGVCSLDCTQDATTCSTIDPNAVCIRFATGGAAYCMQGCTVGPVPTGTEKCHNRKDVACDDNLTSSTGGEGFCHPICRGDFDCGSRKCDLGSGFCVDASAITGTLPTGSPCDPNAAKEQCLGTCLAESSTAKTGICYAFCTAGSAGCGVDPGSTEPPSVTCLYDYSASGTGDVGDISLCGALCDCDTDCKAPGRVCIPFATSAEASTFGRAGYCNVLTDSTGKRRDHLTCGDAGTSIIDGGTDAASGAGGSGGGGGTRVCGKGDTRACLGPGACSGAQMCLDDGSGYGACDCGGGAGGASGTGGAGGTGGSSPRDAGRG